MGGDFGHTSGSAALGDVQARSLRLASAVTRAAWPTGSALSRGHLEAMLDRRRYGVRAMTRRDGRPHAAPVGFLVRGGRVWMVSVTGAARLRDLSHTPYASLVVMEGEGADHNAVLLEGWASLHDSEPITSAWLGEAWRARFGVELD